MQPTHPLLKLFLNAFALLGLLVFTTPQAHAAPFLDDHPSKIFVPLITKTSAVTPQSQPSIEDEVLRLTNELRTTNGCQPLVVSPELSAAAQAHSHDLINMGNTISHVGTDGSLFTTRLERAGYVNYTAVAENIAAGYATAQEVVEGWYNSPGHRENMLNCDLHEIGIAYLNEPNSYWQYYWTEDFGAH